MGLGSPISHCVLMNCNLQETDKQKMKHVCEFGAWNCNVEEKWIILPLSELRAEREHDQTYFQALSSNHQYFLRTDLNQSRSPMSSRAVERR